MFVIKDPDDNCVVRETLDDAFAEIQDTYGSHPIDEYEVWETKSSEPNKLTLVISMAPRK